MASQSMATDDDHIAELLAKEAREASKKYSALGIRALLPTRPTTAAPKPNTRFLKNIIRETDNHNLALKKREDLEARLRLRAVNNAAPSTSDCHERDVEGHGKRRRVEDDGDFDRDRRRKRRSHQYNEDDSDEWISPEEDKDRRQGTKRHSRHRYHNGDARDQGSRPQYEEQHRFSHREKRSSRAHDPREDEKPSRSYRRKRRRRLSSAESTTSNERTHHHHRRNGGGPQAHGERLSPPSKDARSPRRETRPRRSPTPSSDTDIGDGTTQKNMILPAATPDSDSDPLEALVGPLPPTSTSTSVNDQPPLRSRGRGAYKPSASAMDDHFSSTYNPSLDLHPDSELEDEKEDWDMALEALRDREIWKQKGAERLRAAGFGDDEIKKWENSGKEKGAEDVKWTGKGEAREWDRGKVVDEVNERKREVGLEAAWKRKGGGFLKDFKKALG